MAINTAFSDPDRIAEASKTADHTRRQLRRVYDMPYTDMVMYEDRATGERRVVPNKARIALGGAVAYELSETPSPHK